MNRKKWPWIALLAVGAMVTAFFVFDPKMAGESGLSPGGATPTPMSQLVATPTIPADDAELFTVDGYAVSGAEFALFTKNQRAATAQYFFTTYGVEMGQGFWTAEYGGETPSEHCKANALAEIVRYKTERILATERGVAESIDFADLMADMDKLNRENAQRKQRGEVIYGLPEFDPWQYLVHIRSDCMRKLHESEIAQSGSTVAEETLRAEYEANKVPYRESVEVTYERLTLPATAADETLESALNRVAEEARLGGTLEAAAVKLSVLPERTSQVETNTQMEVGKDDFWEQTVQARVLELMPGEVSQPLYIGGTACLLKCIERTDRGYLPFEEVRNNVLYYYAEAQLAQTLAQRAETALVNFTDARYETLAVQ